MIVSVTALAVQLAVPSRLAVTFFVCLFTKKVPNDFPAQSANVCRQVFLMAQWSFTEFANVLHPKQFQLPFSGDSPHFMKGLACF